MNFTHYLQELQNNLTRGSERTHYPALKNLVDSGMLGIITTIEEKGNQAGIPDFTVRKNDNLVGYVEAKKIGENLDKIEETEQLQHYFESSIGENLILTNYLEFRWYLDGKLQLKTTLATVKKGQITPVDDAAKTEELILSFLNFKEKVINNYYDLASQMAASTKAIRYGITEALKLEDEQGELTKLKLLFQDLLLPDLDNNNFADMYAQTIAYGLFTARVGHAQNPGQGMFIRKTASIHISDKIPFLQGLFRTVIETDIISKINWAIDKLVEFLAKVDMSSILENFGRETRQEDPVVHFYETFLGAYEASLRKSRGVYYTPEPVVSFIVQAVNDLLDKEFDLDDGLGSRKVTIFDPATGTGTFLYEVIKQIRRNFEKYGVNRWNELLRDKKVLERLYGFELLMTPYTIAHLKLALLLENLDYRFQDKERLNIYLTNALEEGVKKSEVLLGKYISEEANKAAAVKTEIPIYVVLGNPSYSGHSENKNNWIESLVRDYYKIDGVDLKEKNTKWLQDDYVKFIRFGQWKIDKNSQGILAFVTNHGYLDNPTFRGMRQNLLQTFTKIYILDLHGNSKKKEVSPDGSADKNVFDIQQGVSIGIFIKEENNTDLATVYHSDLWGSRESKYELLQQLSLDTVEWEKIEPSSPFYLFIPQDTDLLEEYNQGWKITDIMPINSVGIVTARDYLTIQWTAEEVEKIINDFVSLSEENAREKYKLGKDTRDWKVSFAQDDLRKTGINNKLIVPIIYRPFDLRYTYYTGKSRGFICMPRNEVMKNMLKSDNFGFHLCRQTVSDSWQHIMISSNITDDSYVSNKSRERGYLLPLYIYPDTENQQTNLFEEKTANLSPKFLTAIKEKLGYIPTPENIFYYAYAVFHSPTYRQRYAEFLKIDFPLLPLTKNDKLFITLASKGETLVNLHLMKSDQLNNLITQYQGDKENQVTQVKYSPQKQQVSINKNCHFIGIPESIWEFKIGGYQVLDKWLKDRKKAKRKLSPDDIIHYQKIVVALQNTIEIMQEIDTIIPNFPIE